MDTPPSPGLSGVAGSAAAARDIAIEAARAAGALLGRAAEAGGPARIDHKGSVDLVTELDVAAEAAIAEVLARHTPDIPILAEEGGGAVEASTRWIVDPLDGTTNFVHGIPHFAVSIALQEDGELVAGVVLDVMRRECWAAARGGGATCNGRPVRVSGCRALQQAVVATGFPYDRQQRAWEYLRFVEAVMRRVQGLRRCGAAALDLAWVAGGRLDGFWEPGLSPWDIAAGLLLVTEAGGTVSGVDGSPIGVSAPWLLATNGHLHPAMVETLAPLLRSPLVAPQEKQA
ncbi:MAG: inositol monophosphatase [Deltaproteobacteria bacterium]|nr:MAG: inositol monophosphatase [Deltaproteobacteria bacterium]